jgi:hypothetical protein
MTQGRWDWENEVDDVVALFYLALFIVIVGVLVAWFITPLYAITTRVFTITFTPWGILAKSPGGEQVLGVGLARVFLGLLIIAALLSLAGVFISGVLRIAPLTALVIVLILAMYTLSNASLMMLGVYDQLWHAYKSLLISTGEPTVIGGQEVVLIPENDVNTLGYTLFLLFMITFTAGTIITISAPYK